MYWIDLKGTVLAGIGYRYLSYSKPEAVIDFYGTDVESDGFGMVQADSIISGQILDTKIQCHSLLLGIGSKNRGTSGLFFNCFLFIESVNIECDILKLKNMFGAGLEGSIGLKRNFRILNLFKLGSQIGYRILYNKIAVGKEIDVDEHGTIYRGTLTYDTWRGPYIGLSWIF